MRNEVERLSKGRGRAPLDKPAKQKFKYLYRIYEAVCFREHQC
jgi:hypothetical protein